MAILIDTKTRLVVQGITGREGEFHTLQMKAYGTNVVAGVTPGKGGSQIDSVPIFDTVSDAVAKTKANTSCIFVPAAFAPDAVLESAQAGMSLVVCITEGIPVLDMVEALRAAKEFPCRVIGPNCPGLISPGKSKVGIIPNQICRQGPVGIVSRSGTLTYEIVNELSTRGLGQSTCVGIGGDPIIGTTFIDVLPLFEKDPQTKVVVLVGEIGGSDEEEAAMYIRKMKKPVVGFISGKSAPEGKRMGHAGAIVSGGKGTAQSKVDALKKAGVYVAETTLDLADRVQGILKKGQGVKGSRGQGKKKRSRLRKRR